MTADILAKIPDAHITTSVARYELSLVRMDDDVVDGNSMVVIALDMAATRIPDLDSAYELSVHRFSHDMPRSADAPSSELVTIHLPSQWKATAVTFPVCPSKVNTAAGLLPLTSYSLTV